MDVLNKVKKAARLAQEQGFSAVLRRIRARIQTRFERAPRPLNLQDWLAYYEKRSDIHAKDVSEIDTKKWPKISILILTYNNFLINRLCLKSIYCNTNYPNFEVVVVDNASHDETPQWLKTFAASHTNMKLILNSVNYGFAGGNNQAAREASGEYLVFLNNDTVVTHGWLDHLLAYMQSDSKVGLVGPVTNSTGNEARIHINYDSPDGMEKFANKRSEALNGEYFDIRMLAFFCVMTRKDQYESTGGLDERFLVGMFEDDDLAVQYHEKGLRVLCAEDVFIHHFQGASFGKLENTQYSRLFEENRKKYEEKWGRAWEPYQSRENTNAPLIKKNIYN